MSMNYGIVRPSFWTGSTGRALRQDPDAQRLALYLMTSPHSNSLGVFRCPIQYMATETGSTTEGASMSLARLFLLDFCTYDEVTETVWVHEMAKYQIGVVLKATDKRQKHVQRIFNEIENSLMQQAFFTKYGIAYNLAFDSTSVQDVSSDDGTTKPVPSPSEANVNVNVNSVPSERAPAPLDPERELFDRGKAVLGKNSGGLIVKLLKAKGGKVALARAAIEQASTKQDPAEYIAAAVRGGAGPPGFGERPSGGFAAILIERHREQNDERTIDHDEHQQQLAPKIAGG
ncbi:MAG: hypothetical protein JWR80_4811 [Bradyrhizobium sp.]|nr:hypothetical protein [Bradyrhizobium sp.]